MTNRTLLILSAAVVGLLIAFFLGQRAETPQRSIAGEPLLPDLSTVINDIHRLEVVIAGGERVATLERREGRWLVLERDGYPADLGRIRQVLLALAEARVVERGTANPELYDRLSVEDIELEAAGGMALTLHIPDDTPVTVILGDPTDRVQRYVRPAGEAQSYLIDRDPDVPREARRWLDPSIIDVAAGRVAEVMIEHADGETVRLVKDDPEQPNFDVLDVPEGRELQYPGVANVTGNALRELRLEDVERVQADANGAPGAQGEAEETTTVRFRTFDGLVIEINGIRRNGEAWITVAAEAVADTDPDTREATGADAAEPEAGAAGDVEIDSDSPEVDQHDVPAEARAINARVSGWRYRIASHQYDQMARRMSDLLDPAMD